MYVSSKRRLGQTDLFVPPLIFGTSCLGNLYEELPYQTKLSIAAEWFEHVRPPVVLDSAGKYGAGLALEIIGKTLRELRIPADNVLVSNKLGWKRVPLKGAEPTFEPGAWFGIDNDAEQDITRDGILDCWRQGCELLGEPYAPQIVSVHDPDEYLAAAPNARQRDRRFRQVLEAYRALHELKAAGKVKAVGLGAKDWTVIRELADAVELDWVMLACSLTVHTHPPELLAFIRKLNDKKVAIINSAVFNAGFLTGGAFFDYRRPDPEKEPELFAWRDRFWALCRRYDVKPAVACVQFGFSVPGVVAVALNTSKPERIAENAAAVMTEVPPAFWDALKNNGLIRRDYPHL